MEVLYRRLHCTPTRGYCYYSNTVFAAETLCLTPGACSQLCHQQDGVDICSCVAGFALASNGAACTGMHEENQSDSETIPACMQLIVDVDECLEDSSNNCEHLCTNTIGGFMCSCMPGTELAADRISCRSKCYITDQKDQWSC